MCESSNHTDLQEVSPNANFKNASGDNGHGGPCHGRRRGGHCGRLSGDELDSEPENLNPSYAYDTNHTGPGAEIDGAAKIWPQGTLPEHGLRQGELRIELGIGLLGPCPNPQLPVMGAALQD